jgi:ribokinase
MALDFLAIGDTVVDEFIKLKEAEVHCKINSEECEICMRWGDKIPFELSLLLAGVGNSANAAVCAARLGLSTALMATIGDDEDGSRIVKAFEKESINTTYLTYANGKHTNHHFVLWYGSERTILVKPEPYDYSFPLDAEVPKAIYLSSLGDTNASYYEDIARFAEAHPDIFLTFQPGTFQMKMGIGPLQSIYNRTDLLVVNKEEAQRILNSTSHKMNELLTGLHQLGSKKVMITDNRNGAFAFDGTNTFFIPMYPDEREPVERTGAGDAFTSSITAAIALGIPFEEALLWGPVNSMSVVQKIGAQEGLLSRKEIESFLSNAPEEYRVTKS